jgi:hypothetical protein
MIPSHALGVFVDGSWTVPMNPITGGMGRLGDFVLGNFAVPQTPVVTSGVGAFVDAMFTVPENVIDLTRSADGSFGLGDDCGCGCGGGGGCGGGLGTITDDMMNWASGQWSKIQAGDPMTLALWGGGALVLGYLVFFHRSGYKSKAKDLRAKYQRELASLRAQYPTIRGRATRALSAF